MKNKVFYTKSNLPVYEVTELTVEEALLALSAHRPDKTQQEIPSRDAMRMEYRGNTTGLRQH